MRVTPLAAILLLAATRPAWGEEDLIDVSIPDALAVRIFPRDYDLPVTRLAAFDKAKQRLYPIRANPPDKIAINDKQAIELFFDQRSFPEGNLTCLSSVPDERLMALSLLFKRMPKDELNKLKRFSNLIHLTVYCEDIDVGQLVESCPHLEMLQLLSLESREQDGPDSAFSNATFAKISKLKHLRAFRTQGRSITDDAMSDLNRLPKLEAVEVLRTKKLTNDAIKTLAKIRTLREVGLEIAGGITAPGIEPLAELPELQLLLLNGGEEAYAEAAQPLKDKFSKVQIFFEPPPPPTFRQ